jgi:ribA/ribD-fused uncharacterized protein
MIYKFADKYYFLSNFYESEIIYKGKSYKSVEHAYQAEKSTNEAEHEWIRNAPTPSKAKSFGNKIKIKSNWDDIKYDLMLNLVRIKFQNKELKKMLLETGNEFLIESNYWHDNTWGNCTCFNCKKIKGKNWLGEILMRVRKELRDENELFG